MADKPLLDADQGKSIHPRLPARPITDPRAVSGESGGTILVVEDEPAIRFVIAEILKGAGFVPLVASSGHEAVNLYLGNSAEVHAIVLDVTLPDMHGVEVCRILWAIRPNLPVLLTSGYMHDEIVFPTAGLHPFAFLQKPFGPLQLIQKLRTLLHMK